MIKIPLISLAILIIIRIIIAIVEIVYSKKIDNRAIKLFHYIDSNLILVDNANSEGLYTGTIVSKYMNRTSILGFDTIETDCVVIGNYISIDNKNSNSTIQLDKIFLVPKDKYDNLIENKGLNFTVDDLINDINIYLQHFKTDGSIHIFFGTTDLTNNSNFSFKILAPIKSIITTYYNMASMKDRYLGIMLIDPLFLEESKREITRLNNRRESK